MLKPLRILKALQNHDVKAVEYFIKDKFDALQISEYKEFIHFGLTSQDINNTAIPLSIKDAIEAVYIPEYNTLTDCLKGLVSEWESIPLLARTRRTTRLSYTTWKRNSSICNSFRSAI